MIRESPAKKHVVVLELKNYSSENISKAPKTIQSLLNDQLQQTFAIVS